MSNARVTEAEFVYSSVLPVFKDGDSTEVVSLKCWVHTTITADPGEQGELYERAKQICEIANAALQAALPNTAGGVGAGYRVVPDLPTKDMLDAGRENSDHPYLVWAAMLAAAPSAGGVGADGMRLSRTELGRGVQKAFPDLTDFECEASAETIWAECLVVEAEREVALASTPPHVSPDGGAGWQPIETAPKDGTVVDLWVVYWDSLSGDRPGERYENSRFMSGCWEDRYENVLEWKAQRADEAGPQAGRRVTHWMRVDPPPPVSAATATGGR